MKALYVPWRGQSHPALLSHSYFSSESSSGWTEFPFHGESQTKLPISVIHIHFFVQFQRIMMTNCRTVN